jgi:hypothetical protein
MVAESSFMQRERSMKESGGVTKLTESGPTCTRMGLSTQASGWLTFSMGEARRLGQTAQNLKASTSRERRTDLETIVGLMVPAMRGCGRTMK